MTTTGLSLIELLDPATLANPYPLYARLRTEQPVYFDPYLHTWVVTRYDDVARVLSEFRAERAPGADKFDALGLSEMSPVGAMMARQMLFLDPPAHTRVRTLAAAAFTARRVERLRQHIREIVDDLLDRVQHDGRMDLMAQFANPLPAIVTAEMLGVPSSDHELLKKWSTDFAEVIGNFQFSPAHSKKVVQSLNEMTAYFRAALHGPSRGDGLLQALAAAEVNGDRFSEDEVIANVVITMVGGQETTTNLIGNGLLSLLRHRDSYERVRTGRCDMVRAVEELLRYESPSQHTARLAPRDTELGGQTVRAGQGVLAVMGAANRDPEKFAEPDRLDLDREPNRHLAFGWAGHYCFGAPLARIEAQIAFERLLVRLPGLAIEAIEKTGAVEDAGIRHGGTVPTVSWRPNLALRGLTALPVRWHV